MTRRILEAGTALLLIACGTGTMGASTGQSSRSASGGAAPATLSHEANGHFAQRNLVSDGFVPAEHTDASLVNAWGLTHLAASPWWVSDNGTGLTTLYDGEGVARPLVVSVAGAGGPAAPTGAAANATTGFVVTAGGASAPARFLFASEDGTISGWNPAVPAAGSTTTVVMVDHSSPDPLGGAVYKGLALATTDAGPLLLATDFRGGMVDAFDGAWQPVTTTGGFVDPRLPAGFAPFGIAVVGAEVVVSYAMQDDTRHDDVAGPGLGFVDAFGTDGVFHRRIASGGSLDSPWGLALAPAGFGPAAGRLLVGNFGDGRINAFRWPGGARSGRRGHDEGMMRGGLGEGDDGHGDDDGQGDDDGEGRPLESDGGPIVIDGLWALAFGNDAAAGPSTALFFSAGPGGEAHGLFGRIDWVPEADD